LDDYELPSNATIHDLHQSLAIKPHQTPTQNLTDLAFRLNVAQLTNVVLNDPRFPEWTGSSNPKSHHYGDGGLAQHVLEVTQIGLSQIPYFKSLGRAVNPRHYALAAIFHDAGKMWDYQKIPLNQWTVAPHKHHIHHIARSALLFCETCAAFPIITQEEQDEITHAILSHHGQRAWGSTVTPQTPLAWLLHLSDMLSARMNDLGQFKDHK
jgi:3'-5' exoribonuclease